MTYLLLIIAFFQIGLMNAMTSSQQSLFRRPVEYYFDSSLFKKYKNMNNDQLDELLYQLGEGREKFPRQWYKSFTKDRAYAQLAYAEKNLANNNQEEKRIVAMRLELAKGYPDTENYIEQYKDKFEKILEY